MNWSYVAGVAAGITGVTGLIGFIVFALLRITSGTNLDLSPAVIEKLKKTSLDPRTLRSIPKGHLRAYLEQHSDISKSLITEILSPQVRTRGRILTIVSTGLLFLAALFGIVYLLTRSQIREGARVQGNQNSQVVINPRNSIISMTNFPKPVELRALMNEKKGSLEITKPEGAFVQNANVVAYRYIELRAYSNCKCMGFAVEIPMKVSSLIAAYQSYDREGVLDLFVGNFLSQSIAIGNTWVALLAKHGMCGVTGIRLPIVITYNDQFSTGRRLRFDIHRSVSLDGRGSEWSIDPMSEYQLKLEMQSYGFAYRRATISGDVNDTELFEMYYRTLEARVGSKTMGEAWKSVKYNKRPNGVDMDEVVSAIRAVYLKQKIQQAASKSSSEVACKIDPNAASQWLQLHFHPAEVIGPSTEPPPPPALRQDATVTPSK
jgi:hypothetical protein